MPNEPGDSWFSPKCIWVQPRLNRPGGRALNGLGGVSLPNPIKPRIPADAVAESETPGDKFRGREGNNPDRQLRSLNLDSVSKDVESPRQPGGWLRSSHP